MALRVRGETRRRNHRRGRGDAGQDGCRRRRPPARSTSSAPAATVPAPTMSRPLAALIVAACGVPVAKHGNRAASSLSGAADTLSALGVKIGLAPDASSAASREAGIGFMMAPAHHAAMRHVGPTRGELGTRTIFNLLGPLSNPAGVKRQLIGVFSAAWLEPMAKCCAISAPSASGSRMATTGSTKSPPPARPRSSSWKDGVLPLRDRRRKTSGLARADAAALKGGDPRHNAEGAERGARRRERAPIATSRCSTPRARSWSRARRDRSRMASRMADAAIRSGAARRTLDRLIAVSNAESRNADGRHSQKDREL